MLLQEILQQEHRKLHPNQYQPPQEDHIEIELLTTALLSKNINFQEGDLQQINDIFKSDKEFLSIVQPKENTSLIDFAVFNTLQDYKEPSPFTYPSVNFANNPSIINTHTITQFTGVAEKIASSDPKLAKFAKFIPTPKTVKILTETSIAVLEIAKNIAKGIDGELELKDLENTYQALKLLKNAAVIAGEKIEKNIGSTDNIKKEEEENNEDKLKNIPSINPNRENISIQLPIIQLPEAKIEENFLENFIEEDNEDDENIIQETNDDSNITENIRKAADKTLVLYKVAIVGQKLYKVSKVAYSILTSDTTKNIAKFLGSTALTVLNLVSEHSTIIASAVSATLGTALAPITGGLSLALIPVAIPIAIGVIKLGVSIVKFTYNHRETIQDFGSKVAEKAQDAAEEVQDRAQGRIGVLRDRFLESKAGKAILKGIELVKSITHRSRGSTPKDDSSLEQTDDISQDEDNPIGHIDLNLPSARQKSKSTQGVDEHHSDAENSPSAALHSIHYTLDHQDATSSAGLF